MQHFLENTSETNKAAQDISEKYYESLSKIKKYVTSWMKAINKKINLLRTTTTKATLIQYRVLPTAIIKMKKLEKPFKEEWAEILIDIL